MRGLMTAELAAAAVRRPLAMRTALQVLRTYRLVHEELRRSAGAGVDQVAELQLWRTAARVQVPEGLVRRLVAEWMNERPLKHLRWCRRRGMHAAIETLVRQGIRVGVLSDYPAGGKLTALGLSPLMSPVLCTTDPEIDALKPHPRGFHRACELWRLSPDEVLYVGDRTDVDAIGARAAGLRCAIVGARGRRPRAARSDDCFAARQLREVGADILAS
jgi:HAD superfamily hydrolase (TIGR01549 family)